jgi:hypothetical protein
MGRCDARARSASNRDRERVDHARTGRSSRARGTARCRCSTRSRGSTSRSC